MKPVRSSEVMQHWKTQRNFQNDVASLIHPDTSWYFANATEICADKVYLCASDDLLLPFGTFKLTEVNQSDSLGQPDSDPSHWSRVQLMRRMLRSSDFPAIILVYDTSHEKYVIADGNHRAIAYFLEQQFGMMKCFVGTHPMAFSTFTWARGAFS